VASAPRLVAGTAGHVDHGKTTLVSALTGINPDRLKEEQEREMTIDLGFAWLTLPSGEEVGIVDVPGHRDFIENMLAGIGGIDAALLVIAADEGVMPQTREHLAIVQLLGIQRGIVVLTKSDLVEPEWIELVKKDVRALLAGGPLADAPMAAFSAVTGAGQAELLAEIDRALASVPVRSSDEPARLPVDRVFTVEGFGTVVTGTLWRGTVSTGDTLQLLPAGHDVRVRRVQVHGATVDEARAGQRTALALHGVDRDQVSRGQWLVAPDSLRASPMLDVRFELLGDHPKPWGRNVRVRFHLGAEETLGRLVLLDADSVPPGASALAQLRLEAPVVAARGDRFVIRSYSPSRTIGGGSVIEPVATKRRRGHGGLEALAVHESGSLEARVLERLREAPKPTATAVLAQGVGESEALVLASLRALLESHELVAPVEGRWLSLARWDAAREAIEREIGEYAEKYPGRYGVMKGELKSGLKNALDGALFDPAFESLVADGSIEQRGERVRPAGAEWAPPVELVTALERAETELEEAGYCVPELPLWQGRLGAVGAEVLSLGYFLGRLVRVSGDHTYTAAQLEALRVSLARYFEEFETLNVAAFKGLTGASRKWAVPLLEHCDRHGWTMRVGDERRKGGRLG